MVDYKNDPKSSTGDFELIYKQNIPPAPAYLGLNLSVRGTQISPKSLIAKKDKSKDVFRSKTDLTTSHSNLHYSPLTEKTENGAVVNNTSQALAMDLERSLNKDNVINAFNKTSYKLKTFKMDKVPASKILANELSKYKAKRVANSQKTNSIIKNENIPNKCSTSINLDSSRRHKSCGPRLAPVSLQTKEHAEQDTETSNNDTSGRNELIECVGNKCGSDNQLENSAKFSAKIDNSPRNIRVQLKPLSNGLRSMTSPYNPRKSNDNNDNVKVTKKTAPNREKNLIPLHINAITKKTIDAYNSQFFAVGLSLRAWQSKYNHILRNSNKNENKLQLVKSYSNVAGTLKK